MRLLYDMGKEGTNNRKVEEERIRRGEEEEDREEEERRRDRRLRKWKYEEEHNPDVIEWGDRDEVKARRRGDCQWDLDPDYSEDFCRRFVANIDGTIDTNPLCRHLSALPTPWLYDMRFSTNYQVEKGRNDT